MSSASNFESVAAAFLHSAIHYPHNPFLFQPATVAETYDSAPGPVSYDAVKIAVERLITAYETAGYGEGHRVALMLDNRPDFFYHWFALNAIGASVVPINAELTAAEQAYLLTLSECCLLVHTPLHHDKALSAIKASGRQIVVCDDKSSIPKSMSQKIDGGATTTATECAVLFTSGSTGQPKACVLNNNYFLEMGYWYRDIGGLCALEAGSERLITPLPLTHMNAMATSTMAMVVTGGCLIQLDRFHPRSWWQTVRESEASVIHYLGVMPAILLQLPEAQSDREHHVKFGFGAGVNPAHHEIFEQRFGFPLIEAWAMTETGSGGCIIANKEPRHVGTSCFGVPDPSRLEYRLVDDQNDGDNDDCSQGELLVRRVGDDPRRGFFSGYYNNSKATEDAWRDGWWHTGDVVRRNADGSLSFVDRSKNIIRRSGENIAALEVEAVLARFDGIQMVAVTPAPDEIRGEEVFVCLILDDSVNSGKAIADRVFEYCCQQLAYFKTPGYIGFVDELPLTATQKPKRSDVKALVRNWLTSDSGDRPEIYDFRAQKKKPS